MNNTNEKNTALTEEQTKATEILMLIDGMGTLGREMLREELEINRKGLIQIKIKLGDLIDGKGSMDKDELFWLREIALDIFLDVLEDEEEYWDDEEFDLDEEDCEEFDDGD
ncbi:MAG: hypothetical protein FWC44_04730 [Methanomassiliicoccaceae archaeon]|nr:hypothetical protein [Methanomassiliicoccaceae archaeon]